MVRVVEGEIGHEPKRAEFLSMKSRPVRLTNVFDERDPAGLQFIYERLTKGVVTQHVRQKDRLSLRCYLANDLGVIHPQGATIDIHKDGLKPTLNDGRDIRYPGQRRYNDLPQTVVFSKGSDRQQIGRGTGVYENAVFHAEPGRPFSFELLHLVRLSENWIILPKEINNAGQVRP